MTTSQAITHVPAGAPPGTIDLHELRRRSDVLASSPLVPDALRNKSDAVMQIGLWGAEHGVPLATAVQQVYVVQGRPFPSSQLGLALVRRAGHEVRFVESTSEKATIRGRRSEDRSDPDGWTTVTWTIADAERAGLAKKDVWKSYPQAMLRARAASDLVKMAFSDVLAALGVGELAPDDVEDWQPDGDIAEPEPAASEQKAPEPEGAPSDDVIDVCFAGVAGCDIESEHKHDPDVQRAADDDPVTWDADRWRAELTSREVGLVTVLKEARRLAVERGETPPNEIGQLKGRPLAGSVLDFVDSLA